MLRYFCVVGPTGLRIADLGYRYLCELVRARVRVRALPIGAAGVFGTERRWYELGEVFTRPMALPFMNVVCVSCGYMLGNKTSASTFASAEALSPELRQILGPMAGAKSADVDYEPHTALASLYTVGVKNVAIVTGMPDEHERAVLEKYDLVIWPDAEEELELRRQGGRQDHFRGLVRDHDLIDLIEDLSAVELVDATPTFASPSGLVGRVHGELLGRADHERRNWVPTSKDGAIIGERLARRLAVPWWKRIARAVRRLFRRG